MWMVLEDMQEHTQEEGCTPVKYLDGPYGPHFWDGDCQIKFAPREYLEN